jgi:hypothetical protein
MSASNKPAVTHIHTFGTVETSYVHGIAKNGAKTHWPVKLVEVRESNRVFLKEGDVFVGVQDNSILNDVNLAYLSELAVSKPDQILNEDNMAPADMEPPTAMAAALEKAVQVDPALPGVTITEQSTPVSPAKAAATAAIDGGAAASASHTKESLEKVASQARKKISEALRGNYPSFPQSSKEKTMAKSDSNTLSTFGVIWRLVGLAMLVVLVIAAFGFAGGWTLAYIAGLGWGEVATIAASVGVVLFTTTAGGWICGKLGEMGAHVYFRRAPAEAAVAA